MIRKFIFGNVVAAVTQQLFDNKAIMTNAKAFCDLCNCNQIDDEENEKEEPVAPSAAASKKEETTETETTDSSNLPKTSKKEEPEQKPIATEEKSVDDGAVAQNNTTAIKENDTAVESEIPMKKEIKKEEDEVTKVERSVTRASSATTGDEKNMTDKERAEIFAAELPTWKEQIEKGQVGQLGSVAETFRMENEPCYIGQPFWKIEGLKQKPMPNILQHIFCGFHDAYYVCFVFERFAGLPGKPFVPCRFLPSCCLKRKMRTSGWWYLALIGCLLPGCGQVNFCMMP